MHKISRIMNGIVVTVALIAALQMTAHAQSLTVSSFEVVAPAAYVPTVIDQIKGAKERVFVMMPAIDCRLSNKDSAVITLLQALVEAKRRGVFVLVLLNLEDRNAQTPRNLEAFFFLNDNGVAVHFDNVPQTLTTSAVVIDSDTTIAGSTIWTDESLSNPYNLDHFIVSMAYAAFVADRITTMPMYDNPLALEYYNQLYLSTGIVENPHGVKAFYQQHDDQLFSLYLYLLRSYRQAGQPAWITVNADKLAEAVGISAGERQDVSRNKVRSLLDRLAETYILIAFEQLSEKNDYKIILYDYENSEKLALPFLEGIRVSDLYFEAGWFMKLTVAEQYVYLFLLEQEAKVGYRSWFWVRNADVKAVPGLTHEDFVAAIRTLRGYNLIAVQYHADETLIDLEFSDFECMILTPYFETWVHDQIKALSARYSTRLINEAVKIAGQFLAHNDVPAIERILDLLTTYGTSAVTQAMTTFIQPMIPENPYKTIDFLEGKLKEAQQTQQKQ